MKVLILDNYDSFTYNLAYQVSELSHSVDLDVIRNDKIEVSEIGKYDKILLSPGPGVPADAGIMPELIKAYATEKSILGVCLGHQAISEAFGGAIYNMPTVIHGEEKGVEVIDPSEQLFQNMPVKFQAARYHSWAVQPQNLGNEIMLTATDESGEVMAIKHKEYDVRGVQFHPESIITEHGTTIIKNWLGE